VTDRSYRRQRRPATGAFCYHGRVIYLFHGSDEQKARTKAFAWIAAARAKEPNLAYVRLAREELSESALQSAAQSGGLFVKRTLVLLDAPFPSAHASGEDENPEGDDGRLTKSSIIDDFLDMLAESDNAVVVLAPKLPAAKAKKLAAKAAKEYVFDASAGRGAARGFNSALVDALAVRSRGKLWLELMRALRAGDAPEMLHGLLHWKARDLLQKGGRAWSREEARALSLSLIALLMDSRHKGLDLGESLERFALSL
jgi:hypothetical protein